MWFKNLHLYRLHEAPELAVSDLVEHLEGSAARRVGWMGGEA